MPMENEGKPAGKGQGLTRRDLLKLGCGAAGGAALTWAVAPLARFVDKIQLEEFIQRHYKDLTPEDRREVFRRLEERVKRERGVVVRIGDPQPMTDVVFGYALNLSLCIGCRQCAVACHKENNHDRVSRNTYIRVFEMDQGKMDLSHGRSNYSHSVPQPGKTYMPVQCHHCEHPPCVDVCPVKATWKESDGIVVIDYNWCIGCRYCEAACPYHARRFNWTEPEIPSDEINPDQAYLSNRLRFQGVMEKCTFCLHRTRLGRLPACLEACPAGARVFGNLLDPSSDIRWVLENKRVLVLKEEWGTSPTFYYFFSS